jgi:hypothetical protein
MTTDTVEGPLQTSRGIAFVSLVGKQDPYVPQLPEVKDRVREEVVKQKSRELSKQKAADLAVKLKSAPDFEKAAKAAGVEPKTTELIARNAPLPDLGVAPAVEEVAFKLPVGSTSDPIATDNGTPSSKCWRKGSDADRAGGRGRSANCSAIAAIDSSALHGENEAEDEDRGQPRDAAAAGRSRAGQ